MKKSIIFRFFRNIDIFGKEPQFYYKKSEKKKSNIGSIFTIIYIILYALLLAYKLYRMINKKDGIFTDSNINPETYESIQLTNDNFYLGFAIEDPYSYDTIYDDTIYYPKAYFKRGVREGNNWKWDIIELETERCKLEKFGKKYQDIFKKKNLESHHCFKKMDYIMEGHFSYDLYSMLYISLHPCKNTTENGNHCKPIEEIDYYLKGTFVTIQLQDILITPEDYNNPIKERDQDVYTTVGKKLFKELHMYFKIVNIETNTDFIGIEEIKSVKSQKYLKYDSFSQMTKLLDTNIYETGESFCDITLKLSDLVFYQKRNYTSLLQILSDLGGLMEIMMTIFKLFLSSFIDALYDTAIVNKIFDFEFENKKLVFTKNKKIKPLRKIEEERETEKNEIIRRENKKERLDQNLEMGYVGSNRVNTCDELKLNLEPKKKYKKKIVKKKKKLIKPTLNKYKKFPSSRTLNIKNKIDEIIPENIKENEMINENENNNTIFESQKNMNIIRTINNEGVENNVINKITYNKFYFYCFFFCYTKKNTKENKLLEEGINIIRENLDIINIFKKINKKETTVRNYNDRTFIRSLSIRLKKTDELDI